MRALYILVFYLLSFKIDFNIATVVVDLNETLLKILENLEDIKKQLSANEAASCCEKQGNPVINAWSLGDIANAISTHKFIAAEQQITNLGDNSKVHQIINIVYLGSSLNVDIIMDFAKYLTNSETKFEVLNALHDEMREDSDPIKYIDLIEAMEGQLAKGDNIKSAIKTKTQNVIDGASIWIKDAFVNISRTAMRNDEYQKDVNTEGLATAIFNFRPDVFTEAMAVIVDYALEDGNNIEKILKHVSSHQNIPQVIAELEAIFNKLKSSNTDVYNKSALNFASHLRGLQQRKDYKSTRQELKDKVNEIIKHLPICARTIYFYPTVCFWNKGQKEYLYAGTVANSYDKERRTIYTWYSGNILPGAVWHVEKIDGYYFFKNANYANEYLYSVNGGAYSKDMRYVFAWIPGYNTDVQSRWNVELDGDYCYIKSAYNNEYMYASGVKYNEVSKYVFTRIGETEVKSAEYQWQLRNCDQGFVQLKLV